MEKKDHIVSLPHFRKKKREKKTDHGGNLSQRQYCIVMLPRVSRTFRLPRMRWNRSAELPRKQSVTFGGLGSHPARHTGFNTILAINPKWQIRVTEIPTVTWGISSQRSAQSSAIRSLRAIFFRSLTKEGAAGKPNRNLQHNNELKVENENLNRGHCVWVSDWWRSHIQTPWTHMKIFNRDLKALLCVLEALETNEM